MAMNEDHAAPPTEAEDARGFLAALAARRTGGPSRPGLNCGFTYLSDIIDGATPGIIVLSGAPSTGKTTLAKQIADSIAELNKIPVLFWSFEQSKEELRIKSLARIASVDTQAIAKGSMDDASWERVRKADEYYRRRCGPALTIIEGGAADTIGAIRSAALLAKHKAGGRPVLVVLDYLQILPPPAGVHTQEEHDAASVRLLKESALAAETALLLAAQLPRHNPKRRDPRPQLDDFGALGAVKFHADVVLGLYREEMYQSWRGLEGATELLVAKNRHGATGFVDLYFYREWMRFEDMLDPDR